MVQMSEVKANLEAAFELANKWREASGQEILAAWLPSEPVNSKTCLLASAFNLNCDVQYTREDADETSGVGNKYPWSNIGNTLTETGLAQMTSGSGNIDFDEESDATLFAEVTGFEKINDWVVALPD